MTNTDFIRTYSELIAYSTFLDRFHYLQLSGIVGQDTFGFDRYVNQAFYQHNPKWKSVRNQVIIRDNGCDLGIEGREIPGKIFVHHMNPLGIKDIQFETDYLLNPEFLVCCSLATHNAIHYGDASLLTSDPIVRTKHDTCPWKLT